MPGGIQARLWQRQWARWSCPVSHGESEWFPVAAWLGNAGSWGLWGGRPWRRRRRSSSSSAVGWILCGGVWPLSPRAAAGPAGYEKPGIFWQACGREPACLSLWLHLLTVPADPAWGHSPGGFKMASAPLLPRGGREGAGRGGGPASWAALRWALASSCLCCECGEQ